MVLFCLKNNLTSPSCVWKFAGSSWKIKLRSWKENNFVKWNLMKPRQIDIQCTQLGTCSSLVIGRADIRAAGWTSQEPSKPQSVQITEEINHRHSNYSRTQEKGRLKVVHPMCPWGTTPGFCSVLVITAVRLVLPELKKSVTRTSPLAFTELLRLQEPGLGPWDTLWK